MIDAWYRFPLLRIAAFVALVALVVVLVWALVLRGGDDGATGVAPSGQPVAASDGDLAEVADDLGRPVYWIGEREGTKLELTILSDEQVFVRYLDEDAPIGDPDPDFLAIGTYPVEEAFETLEQLAEREGSTEERLEDGAIAVRTELASNSVYVAYPGENVQVEVYDPDPDRALDVAISGALVPVE